MQCLIFPPPTERNLIRPIYWTAMPAPVTRNSTLHCRLRQKFVFVFYQTRAFSEYVAEGDYTKCNAGFAAPGLSTAAVSLQGNRLTVKQTTGEAAGKLFL